MFGITSHYIHLQDLCANISKLHIPSILSVSRQAGFFCGTRVENSEQPLFTEQLVICSSMHTVMRLCLPLALGGEMGADAPQHLFQVILV